MMAPVRESVSTPTKVTPDVPMAVEQSWDEIIPEDVRARIKEEEELEEQMQLYLPPRQRRIQVAYCFNNFGVCYCFWLFQELR